MAKFSAQTVVDALEWNFRPYVEADGTVKEPNDQQIADFYTSLQQLSSGLTGRLKDVDEKDAAEVAAAIGETVEAARQMAVIFADLCSGSPSAEILMQVPVRIRNLFYGWLQREVMSPEAAPGAGNAQVTTLRSAAAG